MQVVELDAFTVGDTKAPVCPGGVVRVGNGGRQRAARAGIHGAFIALAARLDTELMRRLRNPAELFARAGAGIENPALREWPPGFQIEITAAALFVGRKRAADIRALLPADAEPTKILQHGFGEFRPRTLRIEIFVAQNQRPHRVTRSQVSLPEGARVTNVQKACGGRRDASAVSRMHAASVSPSPSAILRARRSPRACY